MFLFVCSRGLDLYVASISAASCPARKYRWLIPEPVPPNSSAAGRLTALCMIAVKLAVNHLTTLSTVVIETSYSQHQLTGGGIGQRVQINPDLQNLPPTVLHGGPQTLNDCIKKMLRLYHLVLSHVLWAVLHSTHIHTHTHTHTAFSIGV